MRADHEGVQSIIRQLESLNKGAARQPPLNPPPTGVTSDGMGSWEDSVEKRLDQLHTDVRNLLYGLIGGFILLAGGGIELHRSLVDKVDQQQVGLTKASGEASARDATTNGKIDLLLERTAPKK